jgi:hypothetical protein
MTRRPLVRVLPLAVTAALVATAPAVQSTPKVERHRITLCVLEAKFGNAFTFVQPIETGARPEGAGGATINVTYSGFDGFPGAQAAFEYAVGIWAGLVSSPVPIEVFAEFLPLAPGRLGTAGAALNYPTPGGLPQAFYGDPLADRIPGVNQRPGAFDILAEFNSTSTWYFGTDGATPPGHFDFVSVVLHELGHGLGFAGGATVQGGIGYLSNSGFYNVFDLFTVTETGAPLTSIADPSAALATQLTQAFDPMNPTGPGVYWGGAHGKAAAGGAMPRLFTPSSWIQGSSYSHLDEDVYLEGDPNSLMTFQLAAAEAIHSPGPIVIGMFDDIGWTSQPQAVNNGDFSAGMTSWIPFATPDSSYISAEVVSGVLEFYRHDPPPGTSNQAVVLQNTGVPFGAGEQMLASFELGNSSFVYKRISVLIHDQDFSDLSVCTFWLPPGLPLFPYQMVTHTTKAWTGASISFYAATAGSDSGAYRLDNVSLTPAPTAAANETLCVDPLSPFPDEEPPPDGAELIANGSFSTGTTASWTLFGQIISQVAAGVFEFYRPSADPDPAGVILQPTGVAAPANEVVTARFELGNSSGVRKRVTVLLHDFTFGDLSACTFWLEPGQALLPYMMRSYATRAWTNATLSVYAATVGDDQWIRLDNVSMRTTPGSVTWGTNCAEPGSPGSAGG